MVRAFDWKFEFAAATNGTVIIAYFARSELRRAGDVSPLILREANNQGIDIPRSPKTDLITDAGDLSSASNPQYLLAVQSNAVLAIYIDYVEFP